MAIRFRKSRKIAPGVRATVSSGGASMSFGGRGYRKTISKRGVTTTVGIPGTGIYSRTTKSWSTIEKERQQKAIQRQLAAETNRIAFKEAPGLMVLSLVFIGLGFLSIVIPEVSAWWCIPGFILGVVFQIWGITIAEKKKLDNTSHTSRTDETAKNNQFYSELNTRKSMFQSQQKIVETTNDVDIFERYMKLILDHINWSFQMVDKGMPALINQTKEQSLEEYGNYYNDNALRIAKHITKEMGTYTKARYGVSKIYRLKMNLKNSFNKSDTESKLLVLIDKLNRIQS